MRHTQDAAALSVKLSIWESSVTLKCYTDLNANEILLLNLVAALSHRH